MIQGAAGAALQALVEIIRDKDAGGTARVQASRTVLEIALRERPSVLTRPDIANAGDVSRSLAIVTTAVVDGRLTAEEGARLSRLLTAQLRAVELTEIEHRLRRIEGAQNP